MICLDWKTYYDRFYDWAESTRLRHLSALTDFGPSAEICELACDFYEKKNADRFIRKALAAGVCFTAQEVLDLYGLVNQSLMPQLIKSIRSPITAEELDSLSFWLTPAELKALAAQHHIRLDQDGFAITPETEETDRTWAATIEGLEFLADFAERQAEILDEKRKEEEALIARTLFVLGCKRRRQRRKNR